MKTIIAALAVTLGLMSVALPASANTVASPGFERALHQGY